jgi:hypothetical protein
MKRPVRKFGIDYIWEARARGKRRMWKRAGDIIERGQEKILSAVEW